MSVQRLLRHRAGALALGGRCLVMGIVNVTPDSFSDGGLNLDPERAVAAAARMRAEGADILDVGAESTRPGHAPVTAEEEWRRLADILPAVAAGAGPPVSIDTGKAQVAAQALAAGAAIVNDVWGFRRDPDIAAVTAAAGAAAILMHNRETVDPAIAIVDDILRVLEGSIVIARRAGIPDAAIVVDPGIGFGKTYEQNFQAVAALPRLRQLGFPILLGLSRKAFIGALSDPPAPSGDRLGGTIAANLHGALNGADIIRVHDVGPHVQALRTLSRIEAAR